MTTPPTPRPAPALPTLVLLSHQPLPTPSAPSTPPSYVHPEIIYHFQDDPPLALVPGNTSLGASIHPLGTSIFSPGYASIASPAAVREDEKEVLVMDWDPALVSAGQAPVVRSLTSGIAVRGVKVDWEGVPAGWAGGEGMLVIDTLGLGETEDIQGKELLGDPMVALQRLTQRNALVREALDYRASPLPAMGEDPPSPDLDTGERDTVSVSPGSTV